MNPLDHKPLVTVVIPVYNGAAFIGAAIQSALSQTYAALEVIVVDDGSTDGTNTIIEEHAEADTRIRVLVQQNGGVARARNRAIAEAHGEFIAPLDADDLWEPTKIERQVERMRKAGAQTGLVYCWWVWIDEQSRVLDRSPRWNLEGDVFEKLTQINFTGNASVPLFRRDCVLEAGGYNESMAASKAGGCEDWELVLRIAHRHQVAAVPELLVGYRRRPGSMSTACTTMWRSHQELVRGIAELRPELGRTIQRRGEHQFALYLSGLSFWSGNLAGAIRWGMRSGWQLPVRIAPFVVRLLFKPRGSKIHAQTMMPGVALEQAHLPTEALLPYDRVYERLGREWSK